MFQTRPLKYVYIKINIYVYIYTHTHSTYTYTHIYAYTHHTWWVALCAISTQPAQLQPSPLPQPSTRAQPRKGFSQVSSRPGVHCSEIPTWPWSDVSGRLNHPSLKNMRRKWINQLSLNIKESQTCQSNHQLDLMREIDLRLLPKTGELVVSKPCILSSNAQKNGTNHSSCDDRQENANLWLMYDNG